MFDVTDLEWDKKVVDPEEVISKIEPGMSIFLGTGVAEPRTLVKHLMTSTLPNLSDLEIIQLVSLGDAISFSSKTNNQKFRLKTFVSGWLASEAITTGSVDLIPSRFSMIPWLFESGVIRTDVAFVQITPPDRAGYASLGISVDVAKSAMEMASIVVGEINENVPRTMGNTFVHVSEFNYLVKSTEMPIYFPRWPIDDVIDKVAANVASAIPDGSCLSFFSGSLFEALAKHLSRKRDLGIHTYFFTDAVMDLVKCGAVTNRKKGYFNGKSLTSYAQGTPELLKWLHRNPLIEFQPINVVSDHKRISMNDNVISVMPARKVDLTGGIALQSGKGNVTSSPGQAQDIFIGTLHSKGGRTIFALPSRNLKGESNLLISVHQYPNQFINHESMDLIVTEYGIASMIGRTVRERAQALIDIAHPDDRADLIKQAKEANILYSDQIYQPGSGTMYPERLTSTQTFRDGLKIRFRAILPSDEEGMRKLFYRLSDQSVYYRYISAVKTMPHKRMQEYVNSDYHRFMSIVGTIEEGGIERLVAEGRYIRHQDRPLYADTAFVVDENYQGYGIASYLLNLLIKVAKEHGVEAFNADVLADNKPMLRVYGKCGYPIHSILEYGVYNLTINLTGASVKNTK